MGRRYKNSPIIEALCEFRFESSENWDQTIPGLIYERIRAKGFPKKRQAKAFEQIVESKSNQIHTRLAASNRIQFLREDEKTLVQVGQDLVSVNKLKPYTSWNEFLPDIREGLGVNVDVAVPKGLKGVALRYINLVEVPGLTFDLEAYLEFRPHLGSKLPQAIEGFITGVQFRLEESTDLVKLELSKVPAQKPDVSAFVLDISCFSGQAEKVGLAKWEAWVETAHARVEEIFEGCITDRLREMFEARKS